MRPGEDPIAVEIHRKALENITNEAGLTLVRTSGSSVVTDAMDFSTCLLDEHAEQLSVVAYVLVHAASSWIGTKTLAAELRERGETPRPGDGWIVNDPHHGGAVHQGDVGIIMPTFYGDEHVGWSFANVHVMDVGGSAVSGFNPGAHTVYEEGIRFPLVRVIRDGVLEEPWERYIAANVRVPGPVLNDIRGMIAANNVAQEKLVKLIDRFGLERHRALCAVSQDLTEELLRRRIERLPDGVYESRDWAEFDGHEGPDRLYDVGLRLEVDGSDLRFTFSGAPQADNFINSAEGGVYGCMITAIITMLGYGDLPFNAGIWRPIHVDLGPPGTVVNAVEPAPVSSTHAETGYRVLKVTRDVLSQALSLSPDAELRGRVAGQAHDGAGTAGIAGVNQRGKPCVVYYLDSAVGQGAGAQTMMDGQDAYGGSMMAGCGISNVETHEAVDPIMFLWRRLTVNSGGPGQFRGGQGVEQAYVVDSTDLLAGFGGGHPGSASAVRPVIGSNVYDLLAQGVPPLGGALEGDQRPIRNKQVPFAVRRGDVVQFISGGGGGLGDPLLREPERVVADVRDGYITPVNAAAAYGVVLTGADELDAAATAARRDELRRARLGREPEVALEPPASAGVAVTVDDLTADGHWTCGYCAAALGPVAENWRLGDVELRETPVGERFAQLGMPIRVRDEEPAVVLREHFCRRCAGVLATDVTLAGEPPNPAPALRCAERSAAAV